jgi:DNA repair protein SbcC/Rad50
MLGWIFKKNAAPAATRPAAAKAAAASRPASKAASEPAPAPAIDWPARLQSALGDDAALLALARSGAPLAMQETAVQAVTNEAALKQAERDWRGHDRRLHRLVKQRHGAVVAQREARERAAQLIAAAAALCEESPIPTNRLVELDRDWQALDASLLEAAQREAYAALLERLTRLSRERGDQALQAQRWAAAAREALAQLQKTSAEAAAGTAERGPWLAACAAARACLDSATATDPPQALHTELGDALLRSEPLAAHLDQIDALLQAPADALRDSLALWDSRTPLAEARLNQALDQRVETLRAARQHADRADRQTQRDQARDRQRATSQERAEAVATALEHGEAALAAGHLAETHQQLITIDDVLDGGAPPAALLARIDRLQAGYAQLKGWQHWGGGLARDELVLQAEALAAVAQREPDVRGVKLSLKQQAEVIDDMRARWKELDRLGGATSRSLWRRFEAALKLAHQPIAEHQAQQREQRAQNLLSRNTLIDGLDAIAAAPADEGDAAPDWRGLASTLEHFRNEWRKLGPLEHTVPHRARDALLQRMEAAVARLEAPLLEARRVAQREREALIARAVALADEAQRGSGGRDSIDSVRRLQLDWQQHAKALPLARNVETTLWQSFKTAVDAVFAAREAAFSARDAQFQAGAAERIALIERLEGLGADTPPAELKRSLAEADMAWQRAGPAPRQEAAALDSRWRAAHERVRAQLAGSAQRQWQACCDSLCAKLALCAALEGAADEAATRAAGAELRERWPTLAPLPAAWEQALARRAGLADAPVAGAARPAPSTDELLLQLEMALGVESPADHHAARRELKLQALKSALEARQPAAQTANGAGPLLAALLERVALEAPQQARLAALTDALRRGAPL